jgi:hypothetical protein
MFICRGEPSGSPEPSYVDDLHPTRNVLHKCEERFTLKGFTLKGIKGGEVPSVLFSCNQQARYSVKVDETYKRGGLLCFPKNY